MYKQNIKTIIKIIKNLNGCNQPKTPKKIIKKAKNPHPVAIEKAHSSPKW